MALSAENHRRIDTFVLWSIVAILIYSTAILLNAFFNGTDVGSWIWERHQNQFSWYSRPLFVVLVCYYAYRQKIWHVVGALLLIATSLFWFAAPENVPEHISGYLEWEKQQFFTNESSGPLILLLVVVAIFMAGLIYSFWHRNAWYGLLLINAGTVMKVVVSIVLGDGAGTAAIAPSLSSLIVINVVVFFVWKHSKRAASK